MKKLILIAALAAVGCNEPKTVMPHVSLNKGDTVCMTYTHNNGYDVFVYEIRPVNHYIDTVIMLRQKLHYFRDAGDHIHYRLIKDSIEASVYLKDPFFYEQYQFLKEQFKTEKEISLKQVLQYELKQIKSAK